MWVASYLVASRQSREAAIVDPAIESVVSVRGGTGAWRNTGKPIRVEAASVARPAIAESEWAHAGAQSYGI